MWSAKTKSRLRFNNLEGNELSRIPTNNTPPSALPVDLAPPATTDSVNGAASGPSFNDHLQDVSPPPKPLDRPERSRIDRSATPRSADKHPESVSGESSTATRTTDNTARDGEKAQAEASDSKKVNDATAGDDNSPSDEEKKTDSEPKEATGDASTDATTSPAAEQKVIVATGAEGVLSQAVQPTTEAKKTDEPGASKSQEDSKPVPSSSAGQSRKRDTRTQPQPAAEAKASQTADGVKQTGAAGDVVVQETEAATNGTAATAKQSDQAEPATGQGATISPPVKVKEDDTSLAKNSKEKTADNTAKESENPTRISPRKQTETSGDNAVAVIDPRNTAEVEKTSGAESGAARRSSKSKKTTSTRNKGTRGIPSAAIAPDGTTQPATDAAAKPTVTQVPDVTAAGTGTSGTDTNDRSKHPAKVGGENLKSITKIGQPTADTTSDTIGHATSDTSEAKETTRTETTRQHPKIDRTRFVQRVARAFNTVGSRGGTLRLRLSPPELGSLRIEINLHGSTLTARIEAETSAAQTVLLDSLPALRDRLSGQNINIDRFDVDLLNQSADDSSRQPTGDQHQGGESGRFGGGNTNHRPTRGNKGVAGTSAVVFGDDTQLNVVV